MRHIQYHIMCILGMLGLTGCGWYTIPDEYIPALVVVSPLIHALILWVGIVRHIDYRRARHAIELSTTPDFLQSTLAGNGRVQLRRATAPFRIMHHMLREGNTKGRKVAYAYALHKTLRKYSSWPDAVAKLNQPYIRKRGSVFSRYLWPATV